MHVTHVTWGYPSATQRHEAPFFATQVESLARVGGAQTCLSVVAPVTWIPDFIGRHFDRWRRRMEIPRVYQHNGISVHRPRFVRLPAPSKCGVDLHLLEGVVRRQLSQLKPDIVHVHGANALGLAGLKAARSLAIPTILTLHGSDVYDTPHLSAINHRVFISAMRMPVKCFGVASDLAKVAEQMSGIKVTHLPMGIELSKFRTSLSRFEARDRFGIPRAARVVLFVGNLFVNKGVQTLLDALDSLKIKLAGYFAGEGPLASAIQANANAHWLGPIRPEDIPALMIASDVLVLPSFTEGLGTVLVEAGAAGTPVVGSNVGGIPSLLNYNRGRIVPARDSKALSKAIESVFSNPEEAKTMAERLQNFINKNYDVDQNSNILITHYKQCKAVFAKLK